MKYNILIVEDEAAIAKSEKSILKSDIQDIDMHIDIVDNELDALAALDDAPYDLVIADLNLYDGKADPRESSGFRLLKTISKRSNRPEIMIRSATPVEKMAVYCMSIGLRGYVETSHFIAKTGWSIRDRIELTSHVRELINQKSKGRTLKYDRLTYEYDTEKWFCEGKYMEELEFPYDKLLLYFIENQTEILSADDIFSFLERKGANYEKPERDTVTVPKKVSYRVSRLRKILALYGYEEHDVIRSSKRGGYFAKYVNPQ